MKTSEILLDAARLIETNGLNKGTFFDMAAFESGEIPSRADCAMCAYGAINTAVTGDPDDCYGEDSDEAAGALADRLGIPNSIGDIGEWNDAPDRTAGEVVAELRACAAELAEAGQ